MALMATIPPTSTDVISNIPRVEKKQGLLEFLRYTANKKKKGKIVILKGQVGTESTLSENLCCYIHLISMTSTFIQNVIRKKSGFRIWLTTQKS